MDDRSLLKAFAEAGDERAFRELVDRHVDLVYAAARRQVRDAHLAEDVSQAVFTVLARKAGSIRSDTVLPAWLLTTTRNVARDALRAQRRRKHYEQQAQQVNQLSEQSEADNFNEVSPLLDDALARLNEPDRVVITLRYLKGLPTTSIAAALGISTAAAEKRILRAVGRMRESFARRGLVLSVAAVTASLLIAPQQAPAGLATRIADGAITASRAALPDRPWRSRIKDGRLIGFLARAMAVLVAIALIVAALWKQGDAGGPNPNQPHVASIAIASNKIKVGVIISEATATGWDALAKGTYDVAHHQKIYFHLNEWPQLAVYAILEPGDNTEVRKQLPDLAQPENVIDGTDLNALRKLDVIVAGHSWHMQPNVLNAVDQAVQGGVGFLHQTGFAILTPSFNNQVNSMIGIHHPVLFEHMGEASATVVTEHPILKGLKIGDEIHGRAFLGGMGEINGTALIAAFGMEYKGDGTSPLVNDYVASQIRRPATQPFSAQDFENGPVFCPVYISHHGKGRVLACQWHNAAPVELDPENDGSFYVRCIEWLAGRPVD